MSQHYWRILGPYSLYHSEIKRTLFHKRNALSWSLAQKCRVFTAECPSYEI